MAWRHQVLQLVYVAAFQCLAPQGTGLPRSIANLACSFVQSVTKDRSDAESKMQQARNTVYGQRQIPEGNADDMLNGSLRGAVAGSARWRGDVADRIGFTVTEAIRQMFLD